MAFTGDLEHLPIVDVIQLMNSTRKSGILSVKGRKGESQLVFKEGYIVSANHLDNSVRIGQVLLEMGLVTAGQLEQGLEKQQLDGGGRRPLAITFIEMGILQEQDAHKALQHLIEMTIVEILTWKSGKFTLNHLNNVIDSDFKYYPEKMEHEANVNTQGILMDALRVFDEKMRDGLIAEEVDEPALLELSLDELISVDDLGLAELDHLSAKLPEAFAVVEPFDPGLFQRKTIAEIAPDLAEEERQQLVNVLARHTREIIPGQSVAANNHGVIIYSSDKLLQHSLATVLADSLFVPLAVASEAELGKALAAERKIVWLISAMPANGSLLAVNPGVKVLQLSPFTDVDGIFNAYRAGVKAVLPKPAAGADFVAELILLLGFLPEYLRLNGSSDTAVLR